MDRAETDYRNEMMLGKQKAREEGLKEGLEEGLKEGRKVGLEEGRKVGLEEGRKETARNMLARNFPVADIAEITGLPPDVVEELAAPPSA